MACTYLPSPGAIGSKIKKGCQPDLLILITLHSNCQQCGSSSEVVSVTWPLDNIREIHIRRFQLQDCALEVFLTTGHSVLLAFTDTQHRNQVGDWVSFSFIFGMDSFICWFFWKAKEDMVCVFFLLLLLFLSLFPCLFIRWMKFWWFVLIASLMNIISQLIMTLIWIGD